MMANEPGSGSKSGGTWCSAPNCHNARSKGWRLFSFPREEERCRKWVQNCGRSDLIGKPVSYLYMNCCLCSDHFEPTQFMNPTNPKCRLIWNAVPTLFDAPNPQTKRKLPKRQEEPARKTRHKPKKNANVTDQGAGTMPMDDQLIGTDNRTTDAVSLVDKPRSSSPVPESSSSSSVPRPFTADGLSPKKHALKVYGNGDQSSGYQVKTASGQTFRPPWTLLAAPSQHEESSGTHRQRDKADDHYMDSGRRILDDSSAVPSLKSDDRLLDKGSKFRTYLSLFLRQKSSKLPAYHVSQLNSSARDGKRSLSSSYPFLQQRGILRTGFDSSPSVSQGAGTPVRDQTEINNKIHGFRTRRHSAALSNAPSQRNGRSKRSPRKKGSKEIAATQTSDTDTVSPHPTAEAQSGSRESQTRKKTDRAKTRRQRKLARAAGDVRAESSRHLREKDAADHATETGSTKNSEHKSHRGSELSGETGAKVQGHSAAARQARPDDQGEVVSTTPTVYFGLDGKPLNLTQFYAFLKNNAFQRRLNQEAQWAYICLVVLICLMMWLMWCLGGLDRCRYRPDSVGRFTDGDFKHTLTVPEVLQKKKQYLPMFNEPEWEDVLFCNRGTDP